MNLRSEFVMLLKGCHKHRISLKKELIIIFVLLLTGTLVVCGIVNSFFLEDFYLRDKEKKLVETYKALKTSYDAGTIGTDEFNSEMIKICSINNMDFIITDAASNTVYSTMGDSEQITMQLRGMIFEREQNRSEIIESAENYVISKVKDPFSGSEYLIIWGNMDVDNFFLIRTPMESIRESVRMSIRFFHIVGIAAVLISALVIWYAAKKITDPVERLSRISRQVSELDFSEKYDGGGAKEIALLGADINTMSEKLETTISDLKSTQLELLKDIEERERADERRSEFIANVSHELKTPIALVKGYAEGLKEGVNDDAESREFYCDVIMDEAEKMDHLVKRLILLNQVESGRDGMVMERFDINELIVNCIQSFDMVTEESEIKVYYTEKQGLFVWADEYQAEEVLRNYISNAIHYCGGKKEIHIKAGTEGDAVRISVFNSGTPIPEESLDRLWEKFYKVDRARTREYGGSGLGLSIVKAIMESMKGRYGVVNYDDGVEFWCEFATK